MSIDEPPRRRWTQPPGQEPSTVRLLASTVVLVCLLIIGWFVAPGVAASVRRSFCAPGDPACAAHALPATPTGRCTVITHAGGVAGSGGVVFAQEIGSRDGLVLARVVDRDAIVHWFVWHGQDGPRSELRDWDPAVSFDAGGGIAEFETEGAARAHITAARHAPVRAALLRGEPTGLLSILGDRLDGSSARVAEDSTRFIDARGAVPVQAGTAAAVSSTRAWNGLAGLTEVTRATDGRQSVFARMSTRALADLGLAAPGPEPALDSGAVISLEHDATGSPTRLVVDVAGMLPARLGPASPGSEAAGFAGLAEPAPDGAGPGFSGRLTLSIDLTDPTALRVTADALHAVSVPWLTADGGVPVRQLTALRRWYRAIDSGELDALATVSTYPSGRPAQGLDVRGSLTVGPTTPDHSYFYQPGQGFVEWQRCDS